MSTDVPASDGADAFHLDDYNSARPFSNFLPGIAGEYGKPMWVFYTNRGQGISSFGVGDRNGAMLEFHPANKAYALTPLLGFRSFFKLAGVAGPALHEPFQAHAGLAGGVTQRLVVRTEEFEIEEAHPTLGLRMRVVYFTLPNEALPVLVRRVTVENVGAAPLRAEVLDGLPQVVPWGLEEKLLKQLSRTMEAFAEIRHVGRALPFYKLKVEPSDKPDPVIIDGGFFAFTVHEGASVPVVADPSLVFGSDTSLRTPLALLDAAPIDPLAGRHETLTGCAFAQLSIDLAPGGSTGWDSFFGQAPGWADAEALRTRVLATADFAAHKRQQNQALINRLGEPLALIAGPPELDPYSRQAFLDNTLRGGRPVAAHGPRGPRVFHTFTRKHGDMERDYNAFQVAPTRWSQGNANFRDVNQNRRNENYFFPDVGSANIETFFNLIQLDGNNPLVVAPEKFRLAAGALDALAAGWPAAADPAWRSLLMQPFSPGALLEALMAVHGTPEQARPLFDRIVGLADTVHGAEHVEGYWVDHWTYNLDLLESFAAIYPDRLRALLIERRDFTSFDNDHIVQPRSRKYVLRDDGAVRQLHAVVRDAGKVKLIARRADDPQLMRTGHGHGPVFRTTLLAKVYGLLAVKASLFDPAGIGLEMEAEKPGWCDALNGLPGLIGSSTHEAFALQRWLAWARLHTPRVLGDTGTLAMSVEVAALLASVTMLLARAVNAASANFHPTWDALASRREAFRAQTRLGVSGDEVGVPLADLLRFIDAATAVLHAGLAKALDADGLPVSYYTHEMLEFERLPTEAVPAPGEPPSTVHVAARRFASRPVAAFLEGAVQALRCTPGVPHAKALHDAVRRSSLYDAKLGMYRVNVPLDAESTEIGRIKVFTPGWLENESIFLHMHYKYLLETLRSGLAAAFYDDLKRGLVAFNDPAVYGRSPLENSSFIASSRFSDEGTHGCGFVARLSGATAEWISMLLHMGLGAAPFRVEGGELRFEPKPVLADWLFTTDPASRFGADGFGFKLFDRTWVVYRNTQRRSTYGDRAVAPVGFDLQHTDGTRSSHSGAWLPQPLALALRAGEIASVMVRLA
jgi:hypothetical protein